MRIADPSIRETDLPRPSPEDEAGEGSPVAPPPETLPGAGAPHARDDTHLPGRAGGRSEEAIQHLHALLDSGQAVLVLPSEVFVHFYPAGPEQVINACQAAGFRALHFELIGDELVAFEYLRIWRENTKKETWIRSTHPLVVEYCRARHPELLARLAPVVTPAIACARYLQFLYGEAGEEVRLVYAGLDAPAPEGFGEFDAVLSFRDLDRLLIEREATPSSQPLLLQSLPPARERYLSTPGGLPLPMLDQERASSRYFRKLRGLHTLAGLSKLLRRGGEHLGFIDVLPFEGPLDHPALGSRDDLYWRRELMELAEPPRANEPVVLPPPGLDLSAQYEVRPSSLPDSELKQVEDALAEVGTAVNGSYWRNDPRGFASYLSLAESLLRARPELAIGMFHMARNYAKAIRDATHDALTDLYSYRALVERVEEELGQANRSGASLALLFVDLDLFKEINDEFGHPAGNDILRQVADVLSETIRSTDIAGRFGGDEFVVLLVDSDPEGAARVAEQIRERVAELRVRTEEVEAGTTCSIGVAFHSGQERSLRSADDLFAEADASLYIAKAHGGNRVHPAVKEERPG